MKKMLLLAAVCMLSACNDDDTTTANTTLTGSWKMNAILADPGDGSGTFQPIESDREITFYNDGTLISQQSICAFVQETPIAPTNGTYDETSLYLECGGENDLELPYTIESGKLIIYYQCIEPCGTRYERIN